MLLLLAVFIFGLSGCQDTTGVIIEPINEDSVFYSQIRPPEDSIGTRQSCAECCMNYADSWCGACPQCACCRDCSCGGICPTEVALAEIDSNAIEAVDLLKNIVFVNTSFGLSLTRVYYQNSARLKELMLSDTTLMNNTRSLLIALKPYFYDLANGSGEMTLPLSLANQTAELFQQFEEMNLNTGDPNQLSGQFHADLVYVWETIAIYDKVGLTTSYIWTLIKSK
ncbi:MAG: hypothetical protein JJT94_04590 [Bernardetiaceae bacterium]|nr:hypothetical protein [Bernardetiaceae bacterium]